MYAYTAYHGSHDIEIERGDSAFYKEGNVAYVTRGPAVVSSKEFAVVIRGYAPPDKSSSLKSRMILPYVNGCSTRQLFPPERPG